MKMACEKFRPEEIRREAEDGIVKEEIRRLNALANAASRRLQELLELEKDMLPSTSRSPRKKRERKNFIINADHEEIEEEEEEEEYVLSGEKAVLAANKRRKCNTNNNISNNPKKNKKKGPVDDGPHPPPPLPEDFKKVIQGIAREGGKSISDEILVIQKGLYDTDLAKTQNRLSIPFSKCDHKFLTEEEAQFLTRRDQNHKMMFKEVTIIEPSLKLEKVKLSRWDMNKDNGRNTSSQYVLKGTWSHIVDRNNLKPNMVVQVWSFRVDQELHLALVTLP